MLQIDHVYEFLYQELFKDFECWHILDGVPKTGNLKIHDVSVFTSGIHSTKKIFFYDQEPFIPKITNRYIDIFNWQSRYTMSELIELNNSNQLPYGGRQLSIEQMNFFKINPECTWKKGVLVTSEHSQDFDDCVFKNNFKKLYYFFHGFAALDWYRGYYALNYNKVIVKPYKYDFITFNRIITNDRSYRIYFVSLLKEAGLLDKGLISFGVTDDLFDDWRDETRQSNSKLSERAKKHAEQHLIDVDKLIIDKPTVHGSASADIPRILDILIPSEFHKPANVDAFWHMVTETVFYYDKLHLTEKIFKPIVSRQPFMLLAAPGNLAYLKSYGFKTFDSVIDESYDTIIDNDQRTEAVVRQLQWYCNLTPGEKTDVIKQLEPIIEHNFHHFYGEFRHIITRELLDNTKSLFQAIGYDDGHINYDRIHHVLTH
jgi:hypothetical protein